MTNTVIKTLSVENRDRCTGCLSCMYACSRMLHAHGGVEKAALRVCGRCAKPGCAAKCPAGALTAAPGGGVRLKRDLCNNCRKCVKGCKISALQWDHAEKIPLPCLHCGQCVKYCPNDVISMAERREASL
jgi:Fe-S-cluster-containing dehydrogenase component